MIRNQEAVDPAQLAYQLQGVVSGLLGPCPRSVCVVAIEGPLRRPINRELRHRVRALLCRGERRLVLDLTQVSRIDAAGVGELVRAYNMTAASNGVLRVAQQLRESLRSWSAPASSYVLTGGLSVQNDCASRASSATDDRAARRTVRLLLGLRRLKEILLEQPRLSRRMSRRWRCVGDAASSPRSPVQSATLNRSGLSCPPARSPGLPSPAPDSGRLAWAVSALAPARLAGDSPRQAL